MSGIFKQAPLHVASYDSSPFCEVEKERFTKIGVPTAMAKYVPRYSPMAFSTRVIDSIGYR